MTKVIGYKRWILVCVWLSFAWSASGSEPSVDQEAPSAAISAVAVPEAKPGPADELFLQLGHVGLDPTRVYRARELSIDRAAFHISLEDGVIAFTSDVAGRVTGAFFEGEGEVLLTPPDQAERASMMLHTGAAILEERFDGAYFRFNDDTFEQLQTSLSPADNGQEFVSRWGQTAQALAEQDALRLFVTFSESLPSERKANPPDLPSNSPAGQDRFLHARMQGRSRGTFDVYSDSNAPEQVWAGQLKMGPSGTFYNVWTSYSLLKRKSDEEAATSIAAEEGRASAIDISDVRIRAEIKPPTTVEAETILQLRVRRGGQRTFLFELARTLVVKTVEADGHALVFIHNPALEGSQLARRGNDLVAVVFPQAVQTGQSIRLRFVYRGEVLQEAGPGLLYVGARGTWYPNRGLAMSNFELEFHYPQDWTLVATGKRVALSSAPEGAGTEASEQVSRWVSERPIPVAGFNLGKYQKVETRAGDVLVETYATRAMERTFPKAGATVMRDPSSSSPVIVVPPPPPPSPARNAQTVASASAHAIDFFAQRFGPYPFGGMALTQMPGNLSQGWPGLIFLSSLSFLTDEEQSALHFSPEARADISIVIGHETAHQWWGDLVLWNDYRDQWLAEALANYSSLMLLEGQDPARFRALLDRYRDNLLEPNQDGIPLMQDGAVTLGARLSCSQFPNGYEAISYGRGTWLLHMLRYMLRDTDAETGGGKNDARGEPFVRVLLKLRTQYQGKAITTRQFLRLFEDELPRPLWYEGRRSLDWFYQGWVEGTAVPHYELKNLKYVDNANWTDVSGILLQKDAPDDLVTPVPIYAMSEGSSVRLQRVFADGPETAFHLRAPHGTRRVAVDPEQTLLLRKR